MKRLLRRTSFVNFQQTVSFFSKRAQFALKKDLREAQRPLLMGSPSQLLSPPASVRGMIELDRDLFRKSVSVPVIRATDISVSKVLGCLKRYLLKMQHFKPVQCEEGKTFTVHLNPILVTSWATFSEAEQSSLKELNVSEGNFQFKELDICYDNWDANEILRSVLPEDKEGLSSYSKVGHIVHVNLRDHLLTYKRVIGQVLLDNVSGCKSVVNKLDCIDSTYRNFKMELLSGISDTLVEVKENNCTFKFDFASVYWNPRLATEHERIIKMLRPGDVLYDVFAGVGPFAIPSAKKKCFVLANDLNPESYRWLDHNAKANKVNEAFLQTFNKDGRDFIREIMRPDLISRLSASGQVHIAMNLPALAVEFLDEFVGLFGPGEIEWEAVKLYPIVHVYCFSKGEDPVAIARNLVEKHLGHQLGDELIEIFNVRKVSSMKEMMRVSFRLSRNTLSLASSKRKLEEFSHEPDKKCFVMGKNKEKQKLKSMFKVMGSIKLKSKPKPLAKQLKNLNVKVLKKISEVDKQLLALKETVRQAPKKKQRAKSSSPKPNPAPAPAQVEEIPPNQNDTPSESMEITENNL